MKTTHSPFDSETLNNLMCLLLLLLVVNLPYMNIGKLLFVSLIL